MRHQFRFHFVKSPLAVGAFYLFFVSAVGVDQLWHRHVGALAVIVVGILALLVCENRVKRAIDGWLKYECWYLWPILMGMQLLWEIIAPGRLETFLAWGVFYGVLCLMMSSNQRRK